MRPYKIILLFVVAFLSGGSGYRCPAQSVFYPCDTVDEVVQHRAYALCYRESCEQPSWVFYLLTPERLNGAARRKNNFRADPLISTGSALPADYTRSGYDRGHLCPAADNTHSDTAMRESFYMSNMSPQKPGFNRGAWKRLEERFRHWAVEYDSLYVVTGGVLTAAIDTIGHNRVIVPERFYKIALRVAPDTSAIAFVLPNAASKQPLQDFVVSVDSVEVLTGIDFFCRLPDSESFEAAPDSAAWCWRQHDP